MEQLYLSGVKSKYFLFLMYSKCHVNLIAASDAACVFCKARTDERVQEDYGGKVRNHNNYIAYRMEDE